MLIHELFQEQLLRERSDEAQQRPAAGHGRRGKPVPSFVRTLIPAITHGLAGIPAPPRTAGGC